MWLGLCFLKREPWTRTWVQVVYLGRDPRKNKSGSEESETENANEVCAELLL